MNEANFKLLVGDCVESMKALPDQSINCCVTSPPYFGLRSYMPDAVRLRDDLSADERKSVEEELARLGVKPSLG